MRVIADGLSIATLDPWPPPNAPIERLLRLGRSVTIASKSAGSILVEVTESFLRVLMPRRRGGRRTLVNERFRRSTFGQMLSIRLIVESEMGICRMSRDLRFDNKNCGLLSRSKAFQSLVTVASVCIIFNTKGVLDKNWCLTQFGIPPSFSTSSAVHERRIGAMDIGVIDVYFAFSVVNCGQALAIDAAVLGPTCVHPLLYIEPFIGFMKFQCITSTQEFEVREALRPLKQRHCL